MSVVVESIPPKLFFEDLLQSDAVGLHAGGSEQSVWRYLRDFGLILTGVDCVAFAEACIGRENDVPWAADGDDTPAVILIWAPFVVVLHCDLVALISMVDTLLKHGAGTNKRNIQIRLYSILMTQ